MRKFRDRHQAGKLLAGHLKSFSCQSNTLVLALPRGGVPVAYEVAHALAIPLDVLIVRKLGVPEHEELAMGAIATGGTVIFNEPIIQDFHISLAAIEDLLQAERQELKRRELLYRGERPFPGLKNQTIILVDDGIATGATMRAAINVLREHHPAHIILAVPVAPQSTCQELANDVDEVICLLQPLDFHTIGAWFEDFSQTTDSEVTALLAKASVV